MSQLDSLRKCRPTSSLRVHGALSSGEVNPAAIRRLVSRVSRVQILNAPLSRGRALLRQSPPCT